MGNDIDIFDFELEKRKHRAFLLKSIGFYGRVITFIELIERLAQQNFLKPKFINNKRKIYCQSIGMDASVYSLKGIVQLCEIGDVVDAFTLVRKIRDNLYLDLFFISESLNNKPTNYEFSKSLADMSQEEMFEEVMQYASAVLEAEEKNESIQSINQWFDGEYALKDSRNARRQHFSFESYKRNIENKYPKLKECHDKYLRVLFSEMDNNLNNYVHSNGPSFISNDILNMNNDRFTEAVKDLLRLLDLVKRVFLIDLYFIDSTLFQTDDYMEAVEIGSEPFEGSQYYSIYQIIEEFEKIDKEDHDLYNYLKDNNNYSMKCFYDAFDD